MNPFIAFAQFLVAPLFVLSAFFGFGTTTSLPIVTAAPHTPVACTMEAKECPGGSWVGRVPLNCDFAACPSATSSTSQPPAHPTPAPIREVRIYNIAPSSGAVGTSVTVTGFGFTNDNTVHFGSGAIAHIAAHGGPAIMCARNAVGCVSGIHQTLTFVVPGSVGPSCPPGSMCPMFRQEISPGTYAVYIENENGSSAPVMFTVGEPQAQVSVKNAQQLLYPVR